MSDALDGLSNLTAITANIEALKNAQQNSAAAGKTAAGSGTATNDVDSYLIKTEQNFSQMLDVLTAPADQQTETGASNSDPLAYFSSDQNSMLTSLTNQQNAIQLQQLAAMEQDSALLGKTVTYYTADSTAQQSGVVNKVTFSDNGAAFLVLDNGATIPVGAATGLQ